MSTELIKIAILDLYNGSENQGMRCLRELIYQFSVENSVQIKIDEFEVRQKKQIPGLDFDIFISSGGPGNPLERSKNEWEKPYFQWLDNILQYNADENNRRKKKVFFICHSFQLACKHFNIGKITKRKSTSFGVFPIHIINDDILLKDLTNPFYAVDNRDYQVVNVNNNDSTQNIHTILAIEKERKHIPLERSVMAIRFNKHMIGTQFHPEADVEGMLLHLHSADKKEMVIQNHGLEKWQKMIEQLNDSNKIALTHKTIIPNFISLFIKQLNND